MQQAPQPSDQKSPNPKSPNPQPPHPQPRNPRQPLNPPQPRHPTTTSTLARSGPPTIRVGEHRGCPGVGELRQHDISCHNRPPWLEACATRGAGGWGRQPERQGHRRHCRRKAQGGCQRASVTGFVGTRRRSHGTRSKSTTDSIPSPTERSDASRRVQVVFQDPFSSLSPRLRVRDILAEPIRNFGLVESSAELDSKVAALMDTVHLPRDALDRRPHEF